MSEGADSEGDDRRVRVIERVARVVMEEKQKEKMAVVEKMVVMEEKWERNDRRKWR